jgi:hypothetical protein
MWGSLIFMVMITGLCVLFQIKKSEKNLEKKIDELKRELEEVKRKQEERQH